MMEIRFGRQNASLVTAYARFVEQQKAEFIRQFAEDPAYCWIRVPSPDSFFHRCSSREWTLLSGFEPSDAIVWDAQGQPELWVKPEDKRAGNRRYVRAWKVFTKLFANTEVGIVGRAHQIDHLSPETAAFRQGYSHVRVMAVEARANRTVGAVIERRLAQNAGKAGGFQADWTTAAKVLGMNGSFRRSRCQHEVAAELAITMRKGGIRVDDRQLAEDFPGWIDFRRRK